jgi:hypothetical protein
MLKRFRDNPKIGWIHVPYRRIDPTLYEKIHEARIPKGIRYVDLAEEACSLIRQEVLKVMGSHYENGGIPFDSWELAAQYVKIRKAGWKICIDGSLSDQCIHLSPPHGGWCRLYDPSTRRPYNILLKRLFGMAKYYLTKTPKRPIHEMVKAGDIKLALKLAYWLALPYIVIVALILSKHLLLLYLAPPVIIYACESRGTYMKLIVPLFQMARWVLVAHGYIFLLIKNCLFRVHPD